MSNDKITGWVLWHPEAGIMFDDLYNCYQPDGFFVGIKQKSVQFPPWRETDGWCVREVTITFNDEVKDGSN